MTNYFTALNSASFQRWFFVFHPQRCGVPDELSPTYFRGISKKKPFPPKKENGGGPPPPNLAYLDRRWRKGASVSFIWKGCTAPKCLTPPTHAGRCGSCALGTTPRLNFYVQNWVCLVNETAKAASTNFVTKRGQCRGDRIAKISWPRLETGRQSPGSTQLCAARS